MSTSNAKNKLKICYSYIREQNRLLDILDELEDSAHAKYIKAKIDAIEFHLQKFPLIWRMNARSMHADYRNGETYARYNHANWVAEQTNKKYGRNVDSWMAAKRIRDLMKGGATIPF